MVLFKINSFMLQRNRLDIEIGKHIILNQTAIRIIRVFAYLKDHRSALARVIGTLLYISESYAFYSFKR